MSKLADLKSRLEAFKIRVKESRKINLSEKLGSFDFGKVLETVRAVTTISWAKIIVLVVIIIIGVVVL